jgi:hypothetical protein
MRKKKDGYFIPMKEKKEGFFSHEKKKEEGTYQVLSEPCHP